MCAYRVRLEPVGVEMDVEPGETVLDAAFRQGIALPHGCKEGQCSACKCILTDGEIDMLRYSTFALQRQREGQRPHPALPRARLSPTSRSNCSTTTRSCWRARSPVKTFDGRVTRIDRLTHDIRHIEIELECPIKFWAGQYVDITVTTEAGETITRSFSMANPPLEAQKLEFIIKKYPQGEFSGQLDPEESEVGADVRVVGPYGACFRREDARRTDDPGRRRLRHVAAVVDPATITWRAANSGRSISSTARARRADLFYLDEIAALTRRASGGRVHSRAVARRRRRELAAASAASCTSASTRG